MPLVHHYLAFMASSGTQQVAYTITLLRESVHEWYMGMKEEIDIRPEIGLNCAMHSLSESGRISGCRRLKAN